MQIQTNIFLQDTLKFFIVIGSEVYCSTLVVIIHILHIIVFNQIILDSLKYKNLNIILETLHDSLGHFIIIK